MSSLSACLPPYKQPDDGVYIETGKRGGFQNQRIKKEGVVISVVHLPNPFWELKKNNSKWNPLFLRGWEVTPKGTRYSPLYDGIMMWMIESMSPSEIADFTLTVREAAAIVHDKTPLRVECGHGKHRSVVVAMAIARAAQIPIECIQHQEILLPLHPVREAGREPTDGARKRDFKTFLQS